MKVPTTIRFDADVLAALKATGHHRRRSGSLRRALPAGALKQRKRAWNLQLEHPTK
jgi:hypothetical protein